MRRFFSRNARRLVRRFFLAHRRLAAKPVGWTFFARDCVRLKKSHPPAARFFFATSALRRFSPASRRHTAACGNLDASMGKEIEMEGCPDHHRPARGGRLAEGPRHGR
ncbi:hypothetical protein GLA29479_873 [Lysobacter antibioticus]|uniref:Uncharacterized protein n=1 Tax=Lysobacter antibioticus TaxID=84531 RepID=A0A0S2FE71_LYSAN|nr:hypothetical protein GLA29479_873 [Lysobacter antibioticus]ALN81834.1 hypothetical protein LA76x_3712 [Lysobacter antibioticus]